LENSKQTSRFLLLKNTLYSMKKITWVLLLVVLVAFTFVFAQFSQAAKTDTNFYFCTDEYVNLIYTRDQDIGRLFLTSFNADNSRIHIADSVKNDQRQEGDSPINLPSDKPTRTNLAQARKIHGNFANWSKQLTNFKWLDDPNLGKLNNADGVKFILIRKSDGNILKSGTILPSSVASYLYISPLKILGKDYGCGRAIYLSLERVNVAPEIVDGLNGITTDFDLPNKKLKISFTVNEPAEAILRVKPTNLPAFASPLGDNLKKEFEIDLNQLQPLTKYTLKIIVKDKKGLFNKYVKPVQSSEFDFTPPVFFSAFVRGIKETSANIWVATSQITHKKREIGTESTVNYGTETHLLNLVSTGKVDTTCKPYVSAFDCAIHKLTGLSPETQYFFHVSLKDKGGNTFTSPITYSFKTRKPETDAPKITDIKLQLSNYSRQDRIYNLSFLLKYTDENLPIATEVLFDDKAVPAKITGPRRGGMTLDLNLKAINGSSLHSLKVRLTDAKNNTRELNFSFPQIAD
jgi:hypothetical protein